MSPGGLSEMAGGDQKSSCHRGHAGPSSSPVPERGALRPVMQGKQGDRLKPGSSPYQLYDPGQAL